MNGRLITWLAIGVMGAGLWAGTAPAESNLWISYYYAGETNRQVGEYADAVTLLAQARDEHNRGEDETHRLANTLDRIGVTEMALEDYEQAEQCLMCALDLKERHLGSDSLLVPVTLNNLGDLYYVMGDAAKAERYYRRALEGNKKDEMNIEVSRSLNGMAIVHNDLGEHVEAEELLKRARDIHEGHMRRLHPYCATVYTNLGILYTNLKRYDEAKAAFKQARYIQGKSLPEEHPDVALRLSAEAALCAKLEHYSKAAALEKKADEIRAKFAELNHRD